MQPRTLPIVLGGSWQNDWAATSVSSQSIWLMEVVKDNDWYLLSSLWWTFHVELQSLYTLPSNWFTLIKLPRYRTVFRIWRQQMTEDSFYKIAFYNRNVVCLIVSRLSLAPQITRWAAGRLKVEKVLSLVWDRCRRPCHVRDVVVVAAAGHHQHLQHQLVQCRFLWVEFACRQPSAQSRRGFSIFSYFVFCVDNGTACRPHRPS